MSTPNRNSKPINIQPSQATQLVQALKHEVAMAKAAGDDTAKSQQHYAKAESIKQILLNYQAQQKARQQRMLPQPGQPGQPGQSQPQIMGQQPQAQQAPQQPQQMQRTMSNQFPPQGRPQTAPQVGQNLGQNPGQNAPQSGQAVPLNRGASAGTPSLPASSITVENFNQVKTRLEEFERKIHQLENTKKTYGNPDQVSQIESQITELKSKYSRYQKFAFFMKNQLMERARGQNLAPAQNQGNALQLVAQPGAQAQMQLAPGATPLAQSLSMAANQQSPVTSGAPVGGTPTGVASQGPMLSESRTPQPADKRPQMGKSASPIPSQGSSNPASRVNSSLNLQGITKPSAPSLPISNTINVRPPQPVTMKPNNISRPTLSGGVANGLGQMLGTPAIVKMPTYELNQSGNTQIPDNGGRVLTKRKLNELVQTIGADQGDGKTVIDGDVEELLLDLADEFIDSVTGFACRLAKRRKGESIDVRDVQLHLEKNWNIRIPGYAMDEIRSTRRWQPTPSYQQKVHGVDISKSVNDING